MSEIGVNAKFLNDYFGAKPAEAVESTILAPACPMAERKNIVVDYLRGKFEKISKAIDGGEVKLTDENLQSFGPIKEMDIFANIGASFNFAAAPFKNLFADFQEHLSTQVDAMTKEVAQMGAKRMTPLPVMIQAGVDSAVHIWEAVLKSLLVKEKGKMTLDQFKAAYEKSKELLMDLTDMPLQVLSTLESYLFKREKGYHLFNPMDQQNERIGSKVMYEAIKYDKETGDVNLDQDFMSSDDAFAAQKRELERAVDGNQSYFEYHGCAGKQVIPLMFKYMDQVFEEHFFPRFDEMIARTKFDAK